MVDFKVFFEVIFDILNVDNGCFFFWNGFGVMSECLWVFCRRLYGLINFLLDLIIYVVLLSFVELYFEDVGF